MKKPELKNDINKGFVPKGLQKIITRDKRKAYKGINTFNLKRKFLKVYISRLVSFSAILALLELALHCAKWATKNPLNILNIKMFDPIIIQDSFGTNLIGFLVLTGATAFLTSTKQPVQISKHGICCQEKGGPSCWFLYISQFIGWKFVDNIKKKVGLNGTYLSLRNIKKREIGRFYLLAEDERELLTLIIKHIPENSSLTDDLQKLLD